MSEHHIRAGLHHFRDESSMPIRTTNPFRAMSPLANPHKNPYVARLFTLQDSGDLPVYHGSALAPWVGRWRELFQSRLPEASTESRLIVEIGSHYGKTLSEMAASHPDSLFIGFDITFKRVIKAAERAQRAQIRNMICVWFDFLFWFWLGNDSDAGTGSFLSNRNCDRRNGNRPLCE